MCPRRAVPKIPLKSSVPPGLPLYKDSPLLTHLESTLLQVLIPLHFNSLIINTYKNREGGAPLLAPKFCNSLPPFTPGAVGERRHAVALSPMAGGHMFVIPTEGRNLLFHPSVAVACPSLFARVRISIIPWGLLLLCFHTLTHSFALLKTLSPIFSAPSTLFSQNTRGGGVHPSAGTRSHLGCDPYIRLASHQLRIACR